MKLHRLPSRFRNWFITTCILAGAAAALALTPLEWQFVQTVETQAPGLTRLNLPPETLGAARSNLEDLRLIDGKGQDLPFLIERPLPEPKNIQPPRNFKVSIENEATVVVLESTAHAAAISLESPARDFIKAVRLEASHDNENWQPLATGQPIFRLPEGGSLLKITFAPGAWEFYRLTLDDRRTTPIPITGAQLHVEEKSAPTQTVAVAIKSRDESPGVTRLALDLGAANLRLAALQFESGDPLFSRALSVAVPEVVDETIREQTIANGYIHRVALEGVTATGLSVTIDRQIGSRELIVLIRNQDSPPLQISAVRAVLRPTQLVFLAKEAGSLRLLSGNATCPAARYDLAALSARLRGAATQEATLSPIAPNPGYQVADTLPGIAETGAAIDIKPWLYRKQVQVSAAGVQQLEIDPEVLSRANAQLSDLRLIRGNLQIPYLAERTSISRALTVELARLPTPPKEQASRWSLKLPYADLPVTRLSLSTTSALFERELRVFEKFKDARGETTEHELGRAHWRRAPGVPSAGDLELALARPPQTDTLYLETHNGDNPAIEITKVSAYYPVTRLVFKASPSSEGLELAYGNAQATAPRYDLSLVASPLLAATRKIATTSAAPAPTPAAPAISMSLLMQILFWGALAAVVVGLFIVLARLLPKQER